MIKKMILILILYNFLLSCNRFENKIEIINNSKYIIDSIKIYGNTKCLPYKKFNIKPSKKDFGNLINCNKKGNDGSYLINVFYEDKKITHKHGYFTNGKPIFNKLIINFDNNNKLKIEEIN